MVEPIATIEQAAKVLEPEQMEIVQNYENYAMSNVDPNAMITKSSRRYWRRYCCVRLYFFWRVICLRWCYF
jgi:hypothetical protein